MAKGKKSRSKIQDPERARFWRAVDLARELDVGRAFCFLPSFRLLALALHCAGTLPYDGITFERSRLTELLFHHITFLDALVQN